MSADDYSTQDWKPAQHPSVHYIMAYQDNQILGFCAFDPQNVVCWNAHLCFLPAGYRKAEFAFREMLAWMWANTKAERVVGAIPEFNRAAVQFALRVGCEVFGVNPKSWMKGGTLHNQILVGISRP